MMAESQQSSVDTHTDVGAMSISVGFDIVMVDKFPGK